MRALILHPNSAAQWHTLVGEAQATSAINLKEDLESYLVFLLMRFTSQTNVATSVLGLEFLEHYQRIAHPSFQTGLKDVGDQCLLLAGLFPDRAIKRRVKLSYFVKLGQTAYSTLASYTAQEEELFYRLCVEFTNMMDVLQAMREDSLHAKDLLRALELWHETGSQLAKKRVAAATRSIPILTDFNNIKH